ncbi:coiled-coil domain-containing protein 107 isoform X2 [Perognathus longimembris pacificus]|uniref:coiled-coil domain-containing protein 107 isoform X2 n=1 Tax=Perognathus longimembris pacificus TaxID=214514 RepID=UPI0020191916|nr:coiled-coil domain-containing protein 107 isoform X2 [Perognathus longimembris pacificus]
MTGAAFFSGVLRLLLVSALLGVLGEHSSSDLGAHPGHHVQVSPGATEPRRRPPPEDQRERARAGALPLGALYTAAVVAFVLYKCLQGKDESTVLQNEKGKKKTLQSEQLAQLTQQLVQTEQHLNNLVAQLDPLFERVTTLVGAQRELLNIKLQTIHQLLQDCKQDKGVECPEPEASTPFPEDLRKDQDEQEAADSQAQEEPINWSPESWNLATSWEVEQGLRRRYGKAVTKGLSREGGAAAEGLVKQSLFL